MTSPRDTSPSRRVRANGDGTVYQRKDGRWEAAGYVLAPGNTRKRIRVYGTTRKDALAKLTEKIAASNRGLPIPSAQGSVAAYLTYWLENVAVHHLRENTHTRYTTCVNRYLIPGLGKKKLTKLTAKDIRTWLNQLRTTCQCCTRGIDVRRDQPRCCAVGQCCRKLLSPLTLTYIHSVLKSALEHAVREEEIPRNVARNVRTGTPRPRRFEPLTADEARQLLTTTHGHRLHALFELALHTGLRKGELLGVLPCEVGDAAGGWLAVECGVSAVVIVGVQPPRERFAALGFGPVGAGVGPFVEQGAVEAFDLAVGLRAVGPGAFVGDPGRGEHVAPVA